MLWMRSSSGVSGPVMLDSRQMCAVSPRATPTLCMVAFSIRTSLTHPTARSGRAYDHGDMARAGSRFWKSSQSSRHGASLARRQSGPALVKLVSKVWK